jgi:hypothetical protein
MIQQNSLQLWRRNLEPANLDKLLLAIDNVPFPGLFLTVGDVSSVEEAILVPAVCCGLLVKVAANDRDALDTNLSADTEFVDLLVRILGIDEFELDSGYWAADTTGIILL